MTMTGPNAVLAADVRVVCGLERKVHCVRNLDEALCTVSFTENRL